MFCSGLWGRKKKRRREERETGGHWAGGYLSPRPTRRYKYLLHCFTVCDKAPWGAPWAMANGQIGKWRALEPQLEAPWVGLTTNRALSNIDLMTGYWARTACWGSLLQHLYHHSMPYTCPVPIQRAVPQIRRPAAAPMIGRGAQGVQREGVCRYEAIRKGGMEEGNETRPGQARPPQPLPHTAAGNSKEIDTCPLPEVLA